MSCILFDLDGVFYVGDEPVPGATGVLSWARRNGIPFLFLTNTSSRPRSALLQKLRAMGIGAEPSELLTPPVAAVRWIRENGREPVALFVPDATREEFATLDRLNPDDDRGAGAVVVGDLGERWNFATFNRAFRLLMAEPQPALIALGMTRYWQAPDGLRLDVGPFIAGLQYATGIEPVVLGKPAVPFFHTALELLGCSADRAVMVGDDIRGDIGGAQRAGVTGVLVRTGKFRDSDLSGEIRPDAVLDSVTELPRWWERRR